MDLPLQVQRELEKMGGFNALANRIPPQKELKEKSFEYNALSDPLRLTILYLLKDQPLCVCVINRFMNISNSKLSYHLNILKTSGLIEGECQGNWIIYSLTRKGGSFVSVL